MYIENGSLFKMTFKMVAGIWLELGNYENWSILPQFSVVIPKVSLVIR